MGSVSARSGRHLDNYSQLHNWSVESPGDFWPAVVVETGMRFDQRWDQVLGDANRMPGARWFPGGQLNFAANLLQFNDDRVAIIFRDEAGRRREISHAELRVRAGELAQSLRAAGVVAGDRVAGFLPNVPEAIIAMLAASSIGAIWTSCSPDFGVDAVLQRFGQIRPKVLFAADGCRYGARRIDSREAVAQIASRLDGLELTVIVPVLEEEPDRSVRSGMFPGAVPWSDFVIEGGELTFEPLPFDHPLYILYSSGTTGAPKCIVHGAGGTLIQHLKEHQLHTDIGRDDVFFFFTTCGWMMWNWLVSGLASGATIVLYDGSPFQPDAGALWRIAEEEGVTVFGASAKYFAAMEKSRCVPMRDSRLHALRTILSTGSPLAPASFDYVYSQIKADVHLASISGGTDLLGCFALGNPLAPVYRGELQCSGLGMAVEVFDDEGCALPPGRKGELVCTRPFPSMPVGFWDDADSSRYRAAYFERFANVWTHGDYAERTASGGLIIHGRSDAVLNPGGVRIGTAEIYRVVDSLPEIRECVAIGQAWQGDTRIVLFVVMQEGCELDRARRDAIRASIRTQLSPRHVPAKIIAVPAIPETRSGKISELAVRAVVHGEPVNNKEALANPEALEHYRDLPALRA